MSWPRRACVARGQQKVVGRVHRTRRVGMLVLARQLEVFHVQGSRDVARERRVDILARRYLESGARRIEVPVVVEEVAAGSCEPRGGTWSASSPGLAAAWYTPERDASRSAAAPVVRQAAGRRCRRCPVRRACGPGQSRRCRHTVHTASPECSCAPNTRCSACRARRSRTAACHRPPPSSRSWAGPASAGARRRWSAGKPRPVRLADARPMCPVPVRAPDRRHSAPRSRLRSWPSASGPR